MSEREHGISPFTAAFMFIRLAIAVAILILNLLRLIVGAFGSDIFDNFPLFPFAVVGGFVVQAVMTKLGQAHVVDRRAVASIAVLALDILIASAIGTMPLAALGANIPVLVILTAVAVVWSAFGVLVLGPRIHPRTWFEHSMADFGQSQGNVATGFVLADMADPDHRTNVANAYGYKQLTYEPSWAVASSPRSASQSSPQWGRCPGVVSGVITVALIAWGVVRNRRTASAASPASAPAPRRCRA